MISNGDTSSILKEPLERGRSLYLNQTLPWLGGLSARSAVSHASEPRQRRREFKTRFASQALCRNGRRHKPSQLSAHTIVLWGLANSVADPSGCAVDCRQNWRGSDNKCGNMNSASSLHSWAVHAWLKGTMFTQLGAIRQTSLTSTTTSSREGGKRAAVHHSNSAAHRAASFHERCIPCCELPSRNIMIGSAVA